VHGLLLIVVSRRSHHDFQKAVEESLPDIASEVEGAAMLSAFRREFHTCLTTRSDALFELAVAGQPRDLAGMDHREPQGPAAAGGDVVGAGIRVRHPRLANHRDTWLRHPVSPVQGPTPLPDTSPATL
jgi:hypothetical protein